MTAIDNIAQTIISDLYFQKLFKMCIERSVLYTLNINTNIRYSEKEYFDLLRFSDLLSGSTNSVARNYAYRIITYLHPYFKDDAFYQIVSKAAYSNMGNFPAVSYLESGKGQIAELPFDRDIQTEAKKLIQCVPDGSGLVFTDTQYELFSKMIASRRFSFSGPTSMGKSFVIKAFIKKVVQNTPPENFIILVPTRALINQYTVELKQEMGMLLEQQHYRIATNSSIVGVPVEDKYNYILVLTPERLISFISQEQNASMGFLFIDEAHKLAQAEDARSITTYVAIEKTLKKYPDIKLYFASPNASNPEVLLSLFKEHNAGNSFKTNESPVAQNLYLIDMISKHLSYCHNDDFIPINYTFDELESINDVLLRFGQQSNLVYCNTKSKTIDYAIRFAKAFEYQNKKELKQAASIIKAYIHPDYYLADLVKKGVAYHFGSMPQLIRNLIEELYRNGDLKYIFCTSTLLEGINMPTQNLFIIENKRAKKTFKPIDFWNLAGRAGRLAKELQGNVFCVRHDERDWNKFDFLHERETQLVPAIYERITHNVQKIERIIKRQDISGSQIEQEILKYIANIICIDTFELKNGYQSPIISALIEQNKEKIVDLAKAQSKENSTPHLILSANESIDIGIQDSAYKRLKYLHSKKKNILLPKNITHATCHETLKKLHNLYRWEGKSLGNLNSLSYYAMLMNKWINGNSLNQIISESIEFYYINKRDILIKHGELVRFNKNDKTHINALIGGIIDDIEKILRFQLEKYFNHYYMMIKNILKGNDVGMNWAVLLEYGTQSREIIALQNMGLSRYSAQKIFKECRNAIVLENGILKDINKRLVLSQLKEGTLEYIEAQKLL